MHAAASVHRLSRSTARARAAWGSYVELAKPGITLAVLMTATGGYLAGSGGEPRFASLFACLAGTGLAAAGAGALNMLLERSTDALMARTRRRPLPEGRVEPLKALAFGAFAAVGGVAGLSILANPIAGAFGAATLALYLFLYTPLKRVSPWCMLPGAVSGALPPLIGFSAATGSAGRAGWALFAILFLWQFPHIVALGWLYREDYEKAGLRMLPAGPDAGAKTAFLAAGSALLLIPASVLPMTLGSAGPVYGCGAAVLSAVYAAAAVRFGVALSRGAARALFLVSIAYVPFLLLLLAAGR